MLKKIDHLGIAVRSIDEASKFFENVLGADAVIAQSAACQTEHTLGPEITSRLIAFVEFVTSAQEDGQDIAKQFKNYWKTIH